MSSDEDDDGVKLYNALERNRNRHQQFVSLSSSESEDEDDRVEFASPPRKRSRQSQATPPSSLKKAAEASASGLVVLDDDDDDFMSETEKALEKRRKEELEAEIQRKLALDPVLRRARSIMHQTTTMKERIFSDVLTDIIELDSDEEDSVETLAPKTMTSSSTLAPPAMSASSSTAHDKGERLTLQVRSNGARTDEITIFSKESFSVLYERFCDLHGLPRSAVHMAVDGDELRPTDTPHKFDLESGDLVDAKVDFSKADAQNKRQLVLLRLVVEGKRPEKFKIDVNSTMQKLHASFCMKHSIADPEDVVMTVKGQLVRMHETVGAHELYDNDEIKVEIQNFVDSAAIELKVRYDAKTSRQHSVIPNQKVETLIAQVASHLGVSPSQVRLRVDGEGMQPQQTFQFYELEGGELVEVKLQS